MSRKTAGRARVSSRPAGVIDEESEMESASPTATAVAGEALATGVVPLSSPSRRPEIPGSEAESLQQGDPDVRALGSESVGDEGVGGDMPTPDQGGVDDYGRAMGISEEDSGSLRTSSELLDGRDKHRQELEPPTTEKNRRG